MRAPIKTRILSAYRPGIGYDELMSAVFPVSEFPRAWQYSSNGGPPGCAMAFGAALRKLGAYTKYGKRGGRRIFIPGAGREW